MDREGRDGVKQRDLTKYLHANGCRLLREGRRHSWFENLSNSQLAAVPRHTEISTYLARDICKELGIPKPPFK
jgi:HicA toxin of bacterial toxin-antitoxin,